MNGIIEHEREKRVKLVRRSVAVPSLRGSEHGDALKLALVTAERREGWEDKERLKKCQTYGYMWSCCYALVVSTASAKANII